MNDLYLSEVSIEFSVGLDLDIVVHCWNALDTKKGVEIHLHIIFMYSFSPCMLA